MTAAEWLSLREGSVVSNRQGKNCRVVLKYNPKSQTIKLSSTRSRNGEYTIYGRGDKYLFNLEPIRVRIKKPIVLPSIINPQMANNPVRKVRIRSTGVEVEVYRSALRHQKWINAKDCTTEYHEDDLIFLD